GPGIASVRRLRWRRVATGLGALALTLVAAELAVRRLDPREVWGWGERPSLVADAAFGWKLRPSSDTRLRWLGYDYVVHANALGSPGPEPAETRAPGTLRVLVTGDAFASAEGVDTALAWPRLLESALGRRGTGAEVLNFAITGY